MGLSPFLFATIHYQIITRSSGAMYMAVSFLRPLFSIRGDKQKSPSRIAPFPFTNRLLGLMSYSFTPHYSTTPWNIPFSLRALIPSKHAAAISASVASVIIGPLFETTAREPMGQYSITSYTITDAQ